MKEGEKQVEMEKDENNEDKFFYLTNILTKDDTDGRKVRNKITVTMEIKNSKLFISCSYKKNYFTKTFSNSFTLDELKKQCSYFNQFKDEVEILKELALIKDQNQHLKDSLSSNEETSDTIILNISLPSIKYKSISFNLNEEPKSHNYLLNECKFIIKYYEKKCKICNFNSKILLERDIEQDPIKSWISLNKILNAKLLFSYHDQFPGIVNKMTVNRFHRACDNKSSILMICKSKNEIFGGYTPLSFDSSDEYKYDNESFLFSMNRLEKYPKDSYNRSKSIWCYREYGPSFHYDLYFRQNKINVVKFDKTNYLTPRNWVNIRNCYTNEFGVHLDSLEVFQIKKVDFPIEEFAYNENFNSQFIDKDFDNNFKDNDDSSDFEINNKKGNKNIINDDENFKISNSKKNTKNYYNIDNNEEEKEKLINYTIPIPIDNLKNRQNKKNKTDKIKKDLNEEINYDNDKDNSSKNKSKKNDKILSKKEKENKNLEKINEKQNEDNKEIVKENISNINNEKIENKEINNNIIFDNFISDSIKEKSEKEEEKLNIEDKENYNILFDNEIKEEEISKNVDIIEEEKTNNLEEKMEKSDFYNFAKLDYSSEEDKKKKNNL